MKYRSFFVLALSFGLLAIVIFSQAFAAGGPDVTSLNSPSHPDDTLYYPDNQPVFTWSNNGPATATPLGSYDSPGKAMATAISGDYAYLADGAGGLRIIRITNPASPDPVGYIDTPGTARDVAIAGNYALVADESSLKIINISNPAAPVLAKTVDHGSYYAIAVQDQYAYVAAGPGEDNRLKIYDISDPADPKIKPGRLVGSSSTGGQGIAVRDQYVYLADGRDGVKIVDISVPEMAHLPLVGEVPTYNALDVAVDGNHAYVADNGTGMKVIDLSDYAHPQLVGTGFYDTGYEQKAVSIDAGDGFVYLADDYRDFYLLDVSDPENPLKAAQIDTAGRAAGVTAEGGRVYYADQYKGMHIFGVNAGDYSYVLDHSPGTVPDTVTEGSGRSVQMDAVDGTWYFHIMARGISGDWGAVSHRKINVGDITSPVITDMQPSGTIMIIGDSAVVSAYYSDPEPASAIDPATASISVPGATVSDCNATAEKIVCTASGLDVGPYEMEVMVSDTYGNMAMESGSFSVERDTAPPVVSDIQPAGPITTDSAVVSAYYSDALPGTGIEPSSASLSVYGGSVADCDATEDRISCNVTGLGVGPHAVDVTVSDKAGNEGSGSGSFTVNDATPPEVSGIVPSGKIYKDSAAVTAYFIDPAPSSGIDVASASLSVYGGTVSGCVKEAGSISCQVSALSAGTHEIEVSVSDNAGNVGTGTGSFIKDAGRRYMWTWYDSLYMRSWILMANPVNAGAKPEFDLNIGGNPMGLANFGFGAGVVPQGKTLAPLYPGMMTGPVTAVSKNGDKAIMSQRMLMGDSLEEVLGTEDDKMSDHFYWTWYDMLSAGFRNWILVGNPGSETVRAEIIIAGDKMTNSATGDQYFDITPGQNVTPTFPGIMGGPVEVKAYTPGGDWDVPADRLPVIASQRVLSGYGAAFNELPGIPEADLADSYLWTWYDMKSPSFRNWVLIANPGQQPVRAEIRIAGNLMTDSATGDQYFDIEPGEQVTPVFPGTMAGPVEVTANGKVIATQRITGGPSFGEVPGYPTSNLVSEYHWTWYDMQSSGSANWVLIANPGPDTVRAEIIIAGNRMTNSATGDQYFDISPGQNVTPTFPGVMNGPVEVNANGEVMVSQRVMWKGHFNEVLGTVLDPLQP